MTTGEKGLKRTTPLPVFSGRSPASEKTGPWRLKHRETQHFAPLVACHFEGGRTRSRPIDYQRSGRGTACRKRSTSPKRPKSLLLYISHSHYLGRGLSCSTYFQDRALPSFRHGREMDNREVRWIDTVTH